MDRVAAFPRPSAKLRPLVIREGLVDFVHAVHDEGTTLNYGLANGPALQQ